MLCYKVLLYTFDALLVHEGDMSVMVHMSEQNRIGSGRQ